MKTTLFLMASVALLNAQGHVSGSVMTGKIPVEGALVSLSVIPAAAPAITKPYYAVTKTNAAGKFLIENAPAGSYRLCGQLENSSLVGSCDWQEPTPVIVRDRATSDGGVLSLEPGYTMVAVLEDPSSSVLQNRGRTYGAEVSMLVTAGHYFKPAIAVLGKNGLEYKAIVPFEKQLELHIVSSFYRIADLEGKAEDRGNAVAKSLYFTREQKEIPVNLKVLGVKSLQQ